MITKTPKGIQALTKPAVISTANWFVHVLSHHPVTVTKTTGLYIKSEEFVWKGLAENLLSLSEIVMQKGPVLLTKQGAHVLHKNGKSIKITTTSCHVSAGNL